jgi:hypothetical protein
LFDHAPVADGFKLDASQCAQCLFAALRVDRRSWDDFRRVIGATPGAS